MPDVTLLKQRLLARIASSSHTLTIEYPAKRVAATGSTPGAAPASPLTGPPPAPVVGEPSSEPSKPSVSVKCLWLDAAQLGDLRRNVATGGDYGWMLQCEVLARVAYDDVVLDDGTRFDDAAHVVHNGRRYKVVGGTPQGASFAEPFTYVVGLVGAVKH